MLAARSIVGDTKLGVRFDALQQLAVAIYVITEHLTATSCVCNIVEHKHIRVGSVVVDSEVGCALRQINRVLFPLAGSSLKLLACRLEVVESYTRCRVEHLEVLRVLSALRIEVVSPEADSLRFARQSRRNKPVVSRDELRVFNAVERS